MPFRQHIALSAHIASLSLMIGCWVGGGRLSTALTGVLSDAWLPAPPFCLSPKTFSRGQVVQLNFQCHILKVCQEMNVKKASLRNMRVFGSCKRQLLTFSFDVSDSEDCSVCSPAIEWILSNNLLQRKNNSNNHCRLKTYLTNFSNK